MRCVTRGATSAWNRPPNPMLPNLWIRSSNQYGAPCGLRSADDCRSYATALAGEAKLAGFTTTPIVVGVSGLIGLAPLFVGLSMLPSASGAQKRRRRHVTLSGMSVLDGVGLAIEVAHSTCVLWPDGLTKRFPPASFSCRFIESSLILMMVTPITAFGRMKPVRWRLFPPIRQSDLTDKSDQMTRMTRE